MPHIIATDQPLHYTATGTMSGESVLINGVTPVGNLTGSAGELSLLSAADENAYLGEIAAIANQFPPLPESGWLEQGDIYQHDGGCVMVRRSHTRMHYEPSETPALFIVYRENAEGELGWIAGESVIVGTLRSYEDVTYRCIRVHVTQVDWTPPATLGNLWEIYEEPQPGDTWVDSGETVTALYGAGVIGVTDTAQFSAGTAIRILETEASVTRVHQAGSPGILVIDPHIAVSGGEMIEMLA